MQGRSGAPLPTPTRRGPQDILSAPPKGLATPRRHVSLCGRRICVPCRNHVGLHPARSAVKLTVPDWHLFQESVPTGLPASQPHTPGTPRVNQKAKGTRGRFPCPAERWLLGRPLVSAQSSSSERCF